MSTNPKYLIIDDEHNSGELLEGLLRAYAPELQFGGFADNVITGIELLRRTDPGLIFLDIEMPDGTGFELLDQVGSLRIPVIFVTGYDKYAIRAIKYSALDYLLKPVSVTELQTAVQRFLTIRPANDHSIDVLKSHLTNTEDPNKIVLSHRKGNILLNLEDIVSISSVDGYSLFQLRDGRKYTATHPLSYYEDILPDLFFRVHKSAIINLSFIERYDQGRTGLVHMRTGTSFEIAARRKAEFLDSISKVRLA